MRSEDAGEWAAAAARSPRQTVGRLRARDRRENSKAIPSRRRGGEGRPRPSEASGIVGSIAAVAAVVAYLVWAYAPEPWLRSLGVTYYPANLMAFRNGVVLRQWALAVPSLLMVAAAQGMILYMGSNFLLAPAPTSLVTISDEHARERAASTSGTGEKPIETISDIGIDQINRIMFGNA